jgi:hypothetical protein
MKGFAGDQRPRIPIDDVIVIPEGSKRTSFPNPAEMVGVPGGKRPSIPVNDMIIVPEGGKRTTFQTVEEHLL